MDVMQAKTSTHEINALGGNLGRTTLWKSTALGGVAGGAIAISAPVVLCALGFSSIGPVAGSLAAKWMAGAAISGGVKSGSAYALVQSAAMSGALVSIKTVVVGCVAGSGIVPVCSSVKRLFIKDMKGAWPVLLRIYH